MLINQSRKNVLQAGFTLIELTLVMIIAGILMGAFFSSYLIYSKKQNHESAEQRINNTLEILDHAWTDFKKFPCPADLTLSPSDPKYGESDCPASAALAVGTCTPSGGICKVMGARDIDGDGSTDDHPVLIGAFPLKSWEQDINLDEDLDGIGDFRFFSLSEVASGVSASSKDLLDPWGNKLFYAITESFTVKGFDANSGAIKIIDEFGKDTAGIEEDAYYAIFSTGEDAVGAFSKDGTLVEPCDPAFTTQAENCNMTNPDATFRMGIFNKSSAANRYDDYIGFSTGSETRIWDTQPGTGHINSQTLGRIGINTDTPQAKLDVRGNLRAQESLATPQVCDKDGNNCLEINKIIVNTPQPPNVITGVDGQGIRCPEGQVLVGIEKNNQVCKYIDIPATTYSCGTGEFLRGIYSNGEPRCTPANP